MNTLSLRQTINRILEQLELDGASEKTLKHYQNTGFGSMIRYFDGKNIHEVSLDMLDVYLQDMYLDYTSGNFSKWKWNLIRRSYELLKYFVSEKSIKMPPIRPWNYSLNKPSQSIVFDVPDAGQLGDPDNLFALIWKVRQELKKYGITESTIRHYTSEGLSIILRKHYEAGTETYKKAIADSLVIEKRKQYEQGQVSRQTYQNLRKAAYLIEDMHKNEKITLNHLSSWNLRIPGEHYSKLLSAFCMHLKNEQRIAESSISVVRSAVRRFMFSLEDNGIHSVELLTPANLNDCITKLAGNYPSGAGNLLYAVRLFLNFLYNSGVITLDLSVYLPKIAAVRKTFHEPFSENEVKCLLNAPDQSTEIGKRDAAIMLLVAQTGLRACDIIRLKRKNIDWRTRKINLVQHKTGVILSLPLMPESGNALAEYLLSCRPDCNMPDIFLCHTGHLRPLKNRSVSAMVSRYMKRLNLYDPEKRRSIHSFRRTLGTDLLKNEIPMEMIQQLLGHRHMNSMKPYLSVEEKGLKQCALPLISRNEEVTQQ